jgi:hypothetical protein
MMLLTRKTGVWIIIIGIFIFLLNFITYTLWKIDIDVLGALFFVLGLVITIACGKSMKHSSELLSRKNGVWICVIAVMMTVIFGYSPIPFLNGDVTGLVGFGVFVLGLFFIAVRWNY